MLCDSGSEGYKSYEVEECSPDDGNARAEDSRCDDSRDRFAAS